MDCEDGTGIAAVPSRISAWEWWTASPGTAPSLVWHGAQISFAGRRRFASFVPSCGSWQVEHVSCHRGSGGSAVGASPVLRYSPANFASWHSAHARFCTYGGTLEAWADAFHSLNCGRRDPEWHCAQTSEAVLYCCPAGRLIGSAPWQFSHWMPKRGTLY